MARRRETLQKRWMKRFVGSRRRPAPRTWSMAWSRQKRHARIVRLKRARIRGYDPESPPRAAGAGADPHLGLRYALAELTIRGAEDAALRRAVIRSAGSQAVHTRDYRGSGEYSTMRRSEGFATIEIAFSVGGFPIENWRKPPLELCFFSLRSVHGHVVLSCERPQLSQYVSIRRSAWRCRLGGK